MAIRERLLDWVDDVTLSRIKQGREARESISWWLANFRWTYYVTLKFHYGRLPSEPFREDQARASVARWLAGLRLRWPEVYLYYTLERSADDRLHVHALVGGLPKECRFESVAQTYALGVLRRDWECGAFHGTPYDTRRGAIGYVSKSWNDEELISGELIGAEPIRRRSRSGHRGSDVARKEAEANRRERVLS